MSTSIIDQLEVDFLILADYAEAVNGKLYVMGGGWERKIKPPEGQPFALGFAAGILVPWNLTNREHKFTIGIETADGSAPVGMGMIQGGFTTGRPVKAIEGQNFRALIAGSMQGPTPDFGTYAIRLTIGSDLTKRTTFHIVEEL